MATKNYELNLLVFAEAQVVSGVSLARQVAEHSGFDSLITVVAEHSAGLKERVNAHLAQSWPSQADKISVVALKPSADDLIKSIEKQPALRIILLPGLDQIDDDVKRILSEANTTVVCFEPHAGLESEPRALWLLGEDSQGHAAWFAEHLVTYPSLERTTQSELRESRDSSESGHQQNDWVLLSTDLDDLPSSLKSCKAAIEAAVGPVLLVRGEVSWWRWLTEMEVPSVVSRFIPQMEREQKRTLSTHLQTHSKLNFEFVALICASTFLAAFGLVQNSAAVIIGAMLVAPLMTPILGAGLSLAHGNRPLFRESVRTILIGFLAAVMTSFCFGILVRFLAPSIFSLQDGVVDVTDEMWARTHPTGIDFLVGLVGGSAAAFARTRTHLADALAGAAIAAALVPPIATAGLYLSLFSREVASPTGTYIATNLVYGPLLLFLVNMLTIMIGSSFVLWACGVRSDHRHSRRDRWATRMTVLLMTLTVIVLVWIVQHPDPARS